MTDLRKSRIAESPWFWLALAIFWGAAAIAAIAPKYMQRQARLNQQEQAREIAWRQRVDSTALGRSSSDEVKDPGTRTSARSPGDVWLAVAICCTLAIGIGGLWLVAARMRRFDPPRSIRAPEAETSDADSNALRRP